MKLTNSPVTHHRLDTIPFFLKRDDLLHSHFSGNKARKLMYLLEQELPQITHVISHGSPQANSLFSLAALASLKGWQLEFYVSRIPQWLKEKPLGNYRGALTLGADIIALSDHNQEAMHPADFIQQHRRSPQHLIIPEGAHSPLAEQGIATLAQEIIAWSRSTQNKPCVVALPSGTGTTALYLHQHLRPEGIEVLTCPCVGGKEYLMSQFDTLHASSYPTILTLDYKHHFGTLYEDDYHLWQALLAQTHIEFDLLYDPMMWQCLKAWYPANMDKQLLYIHQGGTLGNESMLPRYRRKFYG